MKKSWLSFLLLVSIYPVRSQELRGPQGEIFERRVVTKGLSDPWEINLGPDGNLWVTESKGYRVQLINPSSGKRKTILDLNTKKNFPRYDLIPDEVDGGKKLPQGGLMGLAIHPEFTKGKRFVYLAYVYSFSGAKEKNQGCKSDNGGCYYTARIVRYSFDSIKQELQDPVILCDTIPASSDHNGGRLLIAPVDNKPFLFYTVGDMGAGQFDNLNRPNKAQNSNSYEGKILRFNLVPDQDATKPEQWIPNDNPFNEENQSAVWSVGHRNPQGLSYAFINNHSYLYSSEHGPYSDDEINIIEKGKNYGHPLIIGYNDGNYNGLAAGVSNKEEIPGTWNTTYPFIKSENENADKIGAASYRNPIITLYPNSNNFLSSLYSNKLRDADDNTEWSSEAPSSIDVYTSSAIPGWQNSLLIPTLKGHKIIRLKLKRSGK